MARRVCFVDLAPLSDPRFVPPAIAQALDVREVEGLPLAERLLDALAGREMLLLLDNFEQVTGRRAGRRPPAQRLPRPGPAGHQPGPPAPALGAGVRRAAPGHARPGAPPGPGGAAPRYPAVRLFVERAEAVQPGFRLDRENAPAVAAICARLDGLPLALELAAPRVKAPPEPAETLHRLSEPPDVLSPPRRGPARPARPAAHPAPRHRLELRPPDAAERALFRRLAVFAGSFTLDGAEAAGHPGDPTPLLAGPAPRRRPARTSWRRSPL